MKYWNEEGKHQKLYKKYWNALVPPEGVAFTVEGNALRAISSIYYDVFNNGAGNIVNESEDWDDWGDLVTEYEIDRFWKPKFYELGDFISYTHVENLKRMIIRYVQSDSDGGLAEELDKTMDMVIEKIEINAVV